MLSIGLVLHFAHTWPPQGDDDAIARAFNRFYLPFILLLDEFPSIRASVHWSAPLLEWMEAHAPDALRTIVAAHTAGRVELVGGAWGGGLLPALPERDVVGQVQATSRWWKGRHDVRLRGAWLPYCGWDPSGARILGRLGLQYTFLEEAHFHPPVVADGYYLTEREGQALALFVGDTRLGWMLPEASPARMVKALELRAQQGRKCVVLTVPGEALGAADDALASAVVGPGDSSLRRLFRELAANAHWLKLVTPSVVLDRMRPTDRAWPPAGITLPVAVAALGGERAGVYESIVTELRRDDVPDLVRCGPFLRGGSWEGLLLHHPELNRLHKRMLRASLEVLRLRNKVREGGGDRDARLVALEEATLALYRGQLGAAYVLGTDVGAQDPAVRHVAWSGLLMAERLVGLALGESDRLRHEQVDYDCDGRPEILVRTPMLCGIVAPSAGGALVELDLWSLPGCLTNVRTRRPEPEHSEIARSENLPRLAPERTPPAHEDDVVDLTAADLDVRELPPLRLSQRGLANHLDYDRAPRVCFTDHFFGAEATLDNVRRGRYPENGDFVGADYQLLQVEDTPDGAVAISVARDGSVTEGTALRLMRVAKRFVFHADQPLIDVRYEVANRYHEPVRTRFGVALNFNLDGDAGLELHVGGRRSSARAPGEVEGVVDVSLVDPRRGWRLTLTSQPAATLWHHPIETVSRTPRGMARVVQGVALVLWWPLELWGLERRRFDFTLSVEG